MQNIVPSGEMFMRRDALPLMISFSCEPGSIRHRIIDALAKLWCRFGGGLAIDLRCRICGATVPIKNAELHLQIVHRDA